MPGLRVSMAMQASRGIVKARSIPLMQAATTMGDKLRMYHRSAPSSMSARILLDSVIQPQQNHRRDATLPKALAIRGPLSQPLSQPHLHSLNTVHKRWHGGPHVDHDHADAVHISFVDVNGEDVKAHVDAYIGESLLQVAQRNDIELEGACEGVCACSTCHVVIPDEDTFDNLEEASEDEEDMLDMAFGLTETSRLGCQIIVTDEMDGMKVEVPPMTRNFYVDGHVPKPH